MMFHDGFNPHAFLFSLLGNATFVQVIRRPCISSIDASNYLCAMDLFLVLQRYAKVGFRVSKFDPSPEP